MKHTNTRNKVNRSLKCLLAYNKLDKNMQVEITNSQFYKRRRIILFKVFVLMQ